MHAIVFQIIFWLTVLKCNASAKSYGPCIGIHERTCVNLPNDIIFKPFIPQCSKFIREPTRDMYKKYANDLIKNSAFIPNGRCVFYQKAFLNGQKESQQLCMQRDEAMKYCPKQLINGTIFPFKLEVCFMCGPPACSSGFKMSVKDFALVILVIFVTYIIRT